MVPGDNDISADDTQMLRALEQIGNPAPVMISGSRGRMLDSGHVFGVISDGAWDMGLTIATQSAIDSASSDEATETVDRFKAGDYGEVTDDVAVSNAEAIESGRGCVTGIYAKLIVTTRIERSGERQTLIMSREQGLAAMNANR
jgi:hypothetical protein